MQTKTLLIIGLSGFLVVGSISLCVFLFVGIVLITRESVVTAPPRRPTTPAKVVAAEKSWSTANDEALALYYRQEYHQACLVGKEAVRLAKKQLPEFHESQVVCASNLGSYYKRDQQLDNALVQFQYCLDLCEKTNGPEAVEVVEPLRDLAGVYRAQGKYKEAALLIDRGLSIRDKVMASDLLAPAETQSTLDPAKLTLDRVYDRALLKERVNTHSNHLGLLCYERERYADAEKHFRQALAWTEKQFGQNNLEIASVVRNHAYALVGLGRNVEAEESLKRVLKLREKEIGADHFDMVSLVDELTDVYELEGKQNDALFSNRRALAIIENSKGINSPEAITRLRSVAYAYERRHLLEEAEGYFLQVAERTEERFGKSHAEALNGLSSLANFYRHRDQIEKAEATFQHAIDVCEAANGPEHTQTLGARLELAYLYAEEEKFDQAEAIYQQVLALREKAFAAAPEGTDEQAQKSSPQRQELLGSLNQLGDFYSDQKKYDLAEPQYQRVLQVTESKKGADPEDSMWVYSRLAELHEEQQQYAQAEPYLVKAQVLLEKAAEAQVARRAAALADPAQAATEAEDEEYDDDELDPTEHIERLVTIYAKLNQPAQAEAQIAKLLVPLPEKPAEGDSPEANESYQMGQKEARLAGLYQKLKRYDEAETLLLQAMEKIKPWVAQQREKWPEMGNGQIGRLQQDLADLYLEQERFAEAETLLLTSIRLDERENGSGGWLVTEGSQKLAKLYRQKDRQEQATDLEACLAANQSPYWFGKKKKPKPAVTPPAAPSAVPEDSVPAPTETPAETPAATTDEATTAE